MWKKRDGSKIAGTKITGDPDVPPTTWWRMPYLLWFGGWKKVVVFRLFPDAAAAGYRLGYKAHDGACRLQTDLRHDVFVRMRIGHEDCTFFAVDKDGKEVWLRCEEVVDINDPRWTPYPLV